MNKWIKRKLLDNYHVVYLERLIVLILSTLNIVKNKEKNLQRLI